MSRATLDHALGYAARGWHVFPCVAGEKRPATAEGFYNATADEKALRRLFSGAANLAIACGASGLVVLDLDVKNGRDGIAALAALEARHGALPATLTARTPTGGEHRYFRATEGVEIRNSEGKIAPGVDVRGLGGYVLAAPSTVNGAGYVWTHDAPIAALPATWIDLLARHEPARPRLALARPPRPSDRRARVYCDRALEGEARELARGARGERNSTLNASAFSLATLAHHGVFTRTDAYHALRRAGEDNGMIGDDGARSFDATFESGWRAGLEHPREIPEDDRGTPEPVEQGGERDGDPWPDPEDSRASNVHALARVEPAAMQRPTASTAASLLAAWEKAGPLVHEPTGLAALDEATRGGPVYGERWYIQGAPDAGKTALLAQIAHVYAARGIVVGLLAVDEEPGDVLTRLLQQLGFTRETIEARDPGDIAAMRSAIAKLPIRLYDSGWTIERAAEDVAQVARESGARCMLGIDSIQTARCEAEEHATRDVPMSSAIDLRVRAVRATAVQHRMIAIATSEMNRAGYVGGAASDSIDPLATAKYSGAIEYGARVFLALKSLPGEADTIEVQIAKNKHGRRRLTADGSALYLAIDRASQRLTESSYTPKQAEDRDALRREAGAQRMMSDAVHVASVLARSPGLGTRELRAQCRASGAMSNERVDAAIAYLSGAIVKLPGERRTQRHYLDGRRVPDPLLGEVPSELRSAVIIARPPEPIDPLDGVRE